MTGATTTLTRAEWQNECQRNKSLKHKKLQGNVGNGTTKGVIKITLLSGDQK